MTVTARDDSYSTSPPLVAFGGAVLLAVLALFNYGAGVYGGAVASALGAIMAALFGLLSE
ncbi:hypothetical protein [Halorubrum sp. Boch-26]|uniref:hypothetical protein n=1 Tax=Halorubrum sp. Boch-26 TaxID=2994426 RepID=UPI0024684309|nr:hypothetical protein [Halorubrum sp. Boch-26]